jgi:2-polyprenyl-3-methyl-5-hydroxy-6-metoxy-1,4-benzoquinol methylase
VPRGALPAGAAVLRCRACHVDFLDTPRADSYWDTPGQEDIYEDDAVARERDASFRAILERIAKYVPAGTLLDMGAGKGEFALDAARAGWRVSVLEPSERATRGLKSQGIEVVYNCSLEDFESTEAYDCVTLLDVIEHTANPLATLRAAARCLRPGGIAVLLTPDGGSALRSAVVGASRIMPAFRGALKYQYYYPHLCYVSRRGFAALAEKSGLEVLSMRRTVTPRRFLMAKLAHHYGKYPGNGVFASFVRAAYPLAGLCLGNKLLAFARKIK